MQLREVTENLKTEKMHFEELSRDHESLTKKFVATKEALCAEVKAHRETCSKMTDIETAVKNVETDRVFLVMSLLIPNYNFF